VSHVDRKAGGLETYANPLEFGRKAMRFQWVVSPL
jgi:hypothetical protein